MRHDDPHRRHKLSDRQSFPQEPCRFARVRAVSHSQWREAIDRLLDDGNDVESYERADVD